MDPERWQKVKEVFHAALELRPEERPAYLDRKCAEDSELRAEVERLLGEQPRAAGFLEDSPVVEGLDSALPPCPDGARQAQPPVPRQIGKYRILGLLGQGGMGVVYRAEQDKPRRTVALKVIQAGRASTQLLKRFEHESQVLGRLQHPGIAQIFEAGTATTAQGPQPFFAMELIQGRPLIDFAEAHHLGTRQRLELLIKICDAVQHAHIKGVIHRDLKPGNILVDETGQPKVLDFGVARLTDADLQVTTAQTDVGQLIGTLPYMSPEQVTGDPAELDTRSDIYALGVLAYELLAGRLPYDLKRKVIAEAARVIREKEPAPLSSVNKVFRGDLETIVSKALEKDKARRYQTATDLGEDLSRYLRDEPIVARPASALYQLRKFARRNKALVGGVAVAFLALALGLAATSAALVRAVRSDRLAARHLEQAEREAKKATAVNEFLQNMMTSADPLFGVGREVTVLEALDRAAEQLNSELDDEPEVKATIHQVLGDTYKNLGKTDQAESHLRAALRIWREHFGADQAAQAKCLNDLGLVLKDRGRLDEAESLLQEALTRQRESRSGGSAEVARSLDLLGSVKRDQGDYQASESLHREALAIYRGAGGDSPLAMTRCMNNLARVLCEKSDFLAAEPLCRESLETRRKLLGEEHPFTASSAEVLAAVLKARGEYAEAEALYRDALRICRKQLGEEHGRVARILINMASALNRQGKYEEARTCYRDALDIVRKREGDDHPAVASILGNLGTLEFALGQYQEAARLFREALAKTRKVLGEEHPNAAQLLANLGGALTAGGDHREAEVVLRQAYELSAKLLGEEHLLVAQCKLNLAGVLIELGEHEEAEPLLRQALEVIRKSVGDVHPAVADALYNLALVSSHLGDEGAAEQYFRDAAAVQRKVLPANHPSLADTLVGMGEILVRRSAAAEAESALREALQIRREALPEGDPLTAEAQNALGGCLILLRRYDEAEALLLESYENLQKELGGESTQARRALQRIVDLYEAWNKPDRADEYRALLGEPAAGESSDSAP
jgi:tetratricopeptide (TPR) repeat protein/predicted Ser/Thr protein kinase